MDSVTIPLSILGIILSAILAAVSWLIIKVIEYGSAIAVLQEIAKTHTSGLDKISEKLDDIREKL